MERENSMRMLLACQLNHAAQGQHKYAFRLSIHVICKCAEYTLQLLTQLSFFDGDFIKEGKNYSIKKESSFHVTPDNLMDSVTFSLKYLVLPTLYGL